MDVKVITIDGKDYNVKDDIARQEAETANTGLTTKLSSATLKATYTEATETLRIELVTSKS